MAQPQGPTYLGQIRWLRAKNASTTETIPACGLVRVVSVDAEGLLTVDAPNSSGQDVVINGLQPIAPEGYGSVTFDFPAFALFEAADDPAPVTGSSWGAGANTYKLRKGWSGFTILGGADNGRVMVMPPLCCSGGGSGSGPGA